MRNFKFLATAIVAAVLACVLAFASLAATTPFTDVDDKKNPELAEAVSLLNGIGVAKGTSEKTFGTMEHVTRQQMAAFVYRLMNKGKSYEGGSNLSPFVDLTDSTYYSYVSWASVNGIIKGTSNTTFNPKGGIMLQDAYTMLVRALGYEEDDFGYPHSYINVAEKIGLDANLDPVVDYTTKLTRGDVAVLLYNTFFAEMNVDEDDEKFNSVLGKYFASQNDEAPTLATNVYKIESGKFSVRATPKYAFNDSKNSTEYEPLCNVYNEDMLRLIAADDDEPIKEIICAFEDTGLSGSADDYIMRGLEVFYTYSEKSGKKVVDKIYFMNGSQKVLETTAVDESDAHRFLPKSGAQAGDWYKYTYGERNGQKSDYLHTRNYLKVQETLIYFYDAPYSYAKPEYTATMTDAQMKEARNAKNAKLVNLKCLDAEKGTYSYYVDTVNDIKNADDMIIVFNRIFSKGAYKLKFFDVEADGIYEYVHYMPATYGFMDDNRNKKFSTSMTGNKPVLKSEKGSSRDVGFKPTIYYNGATVTGAKFEEGDMVVAYLNPEANMIDVQAVVKPYKGYMNKVQREHGRAQIDNTFFRTIYSWRVVEEFTDAYNSTYYNRYHLAPEAEKGNYNDYFTLHVFSGHGNDTTFEGFLNEDNYGEAFEVYAFKCFGETNVLWYDHLEDVSSNVDFADIALVVGADDGQRGKTTTTNSKFDDKTGKMFYYAKVYYNGQVKNLPIDAEEFYPQLSFSNGEYSLFNTTGFASTPTAYVDKLCRISVKNGLYTLTPILHSIDEFTKAYNGIERDGSVLNDKEYNKLFGNDIDYNTSVKLEKYIGNLYTLKSVDDNKSVLGDVFGTYQNNSTPINYFSLTDSSKIIIKNTIVKGSDRDVEYLEFNADNFGGTVETELVNVQYVLKCNANTTTKADLVLLYAEAENFEFETKSIKNGWRLVTGMSREKTEDGEFRYSYSLFNPYTGAVEENVPGEDTYESAQDLTTRVTVKVGDIVDVKNSKVDEDGKKLGAIDTSVSKGLVYITEVDTEMNAVNVIPVEAFDKAIQGGAIKSGDDIEGFVESYKYAGELNFDGKIFALRVDGNDRPDASKGLAYEISEDTVISVLTSKKAGKYALENGEFGLSDISALAEASEDLLCYNEGVIQNDDSYGTGYSQYVKAYVYSSDNADDEESLPVAEFIIVVVNGGEKGLVLSDDDSNFLNETDSN